MQDFSWRRRRRDKWGKEGGREGGMEEGWEIKGGEN